MMPSPLPPTPTIGMAVKLLCGANGRSGKPCKMGAGWSTDHPGFGRCKLHGGKTPTQRVQVQRQMAEANLRELATRPGSENLFALIDLPAGDVDPVAELFETLRVATWREVVLRRQLREMEAGLAEFQDDQSAMISTRTMARMHHEAVELKARVARMAIDAGLDERIVRVAEKQADTLLFAIAAALDVIPGLDRAVRSLAESRAAEVLEGAVKQLPERVGA